MAESYIQQLIAERIGGSGFGKDTVLYKFEKIKRAKKAAMAAYPDVEIIDMGVGCLLYTSNESPGRLRFFKSKLQAFIRRTGLKWLCLVPRAPISVRYVRILERSWDAALTCPDWLGRRPAGLPWKEVLP